MKRIENFHKSLQFDRLDVTRIVEAQLKGVIETYTLTTVNTMNARRDPNICLWCGKVQSIDHDCESKPDYNCWFTFGEEGEGVAFVKVSKYGLQHGEEHVLQNDALDPGAHNMFDEMSEPNTFVSPAVEFVSNASKVFDELPEPNLGSVNAPIVEASVAQKVFDKMPDQVTSSNPLEASLIEYSIESQVLSAQKEFDELPLPDFIKELAETSRAMELDPIGGDCDYTLDVHEVEDDNSTHSIHIFRKFVYAGNFLDVYAGNLCHEYPHFQEAYRWDKRNADFQRFGWNMMLQLICSCRFVFDPGVFLMVEKQVEISLLIIFCDWQNDWSINVVYQELHTHGKVYVHLTLRGRLFDNIQSLSDHLVDAYCLSSIALSHNLLMKPRTKNDDIDLQVHLFYFFYLPLVLYCWQPSVSSLSFGMSMLSSWLTKQEFVPSYEPHFTFTTMVMMALSLTLEDKGDFRGEEDKILEKYSRERFIVVVSWRTKCHKGHEFGNDMMKFTYVVACQVHDIHKMAEDSRAMEILYLMKNNEALRVAYVAEVHLGRDEVQYYSVLVKYDQQLQREVEIYRVQLPGSIKQGEGKPENQNHAIIFTRGDALQTIDMNQDNYFEEALKMRNLLDEFNKFKGLVPEHHSHFIGSFNLTSHFTLYLHQGVVLLVSHNESECHVLPLLPSYGKGMDDTNARFCSLIFGTNLTDVVITGGNSTIDGQGAYWWDKFKKEELKLTRPYLIEIMYSDQVQIFNLTFLNSPSWNVIVRNVFESGGGWYLFVVPYGRQKLQCSNDKNLCSIDPTTLFLHSGMQKEGLHNFELVKRDFPGISVSLLTLLQWFHNDEHQPFMVWVFDPGGYDSEPTMTKRPQVYPYGAKRRKFRRHEDYQSYVFDPGGSLVLQDYKSEMLWGMEGVCLLSLRTRIISRGR